MTTELERLGNELTLTKGALEGCRENLAEAKAEIEWWKAELLFALADLRKANSTIERRILQESMPDYSAMANHIAKLQAELAALRLDYKAADAVIIILEEEIKFRTAKQEKAEVALAALKGGVEVSIQRGTNLHGWLYLNVPADGSYGGCRIPGDLHPEIKPGETRKALIVLIPEEAPCSDSSK